MESEPTDITHADKAERTRVRWSFSGLQFTYWAALGALAFNSQLLKSCGFNSTEVGLLMALNFLAGMVAPPIWGYLADKIRSMKKTFIIVLCCTMVGSVLLPLSKHVLIGTFPTIAFMYPAFTLFRAPSNSLLDGWTVTKCNELGLTYSHIRLFGSLGYAIMASALTVVAEKFGIEAPYFICAALLGVLVLMAARQPAEKAAQEEAAVEGARQVKVKLSPKLLFKNYYFVVFVLFNIALTIASNAAASFMPYVLESIGANANMTGLVGGLRAACEIPVMLLGHKLIKRFKLSTLLGTVGAIYVFCQFAFQFINSLAGIILCQCLQGVGYGLYLSAAIQYAFTLAPVQLRATAQSLVTTTTFAGSILSSLLGGWLIAAIGIKGMLLVTGSIILVCLVIYIASFPLGRKVNKSESIEHVA